MLKKTVLGFINLIVTCCYMAKCIGSSNARMKVVPSVAFGNLEEFYHQVRTINQNLRETQATEEVADPKVKSSICRSILNSMIMRQKQPSLKPVSLNNRFAIHYWNFKYSRSEMRDTLRKEMGGAWEGSFEYPSKERTIRDSQFVDNAFICIGQDSDGYKDFYISQEYNINLSVNNGEPHVAARFVLILSGNDKMMIYLIATETAVVIKDEQKQVEVTYADSRSQRAVLAREDEPLCLLNDKKRLQICWSVLNSSYFDAMVVESVSEGTSSCTLEYVLIREYMSIQREWMIDCRAKIRNKAKKSSWYYVSRGIDADTYCVYSIGNKEPGKDMFTIVNISSNIVQYL